MSAHLDEKYFEWLYLQVFPSRVKNPMQNYAELCDILYRTEFIWLVPNDDNRAEDGKALRYEFLDAEGIDVPEEEDYWLDLSCSVLELLIALARRLNFNTDDDIHYWVMEMLSNLGLEHFDDVSQFTEREVRRVLERLVWRTYQYDGTGGLFPLEHPDQDQREVEIWYQLNAYLIERNYV